MLAIGLMSGTSMDGIDCALLETDGTPNHLNPIDFVSLDYLPAFKLLLKATEFIIRSYSGDLAAAQVDFQTGVIHYLSKECLLNSQQCDNKLSEFKSLLNISQLTLDAVITHSTMLHAKAVTMLLEKAGKQHSDIVVIGYHGQTMYHRVHEQRSIILGDGYRLAHQLQIPVINDFRSQDMMHGGQGAPFAPVYHQALAVRDQLLPLCVVNCGGIANISLIVDDNPNHLLAFDTGPGNALIDRLVRQRTQGLMHFDQNGQYGLAGHVNDKVFAQLYQQHSTLLSKKPPKALDVGDLILIEDLDRLSLNDACRTLEAFTADTIVSSLDLIECSIPTRWILAGGGWHNPAILIELKDRLQKKVGKPIQIQTADEIHWQGQALEAQLFAYLAIRSLHKQPLSYPGTTGVQSPQTGGVLHVA